MRPEFNFALLKFTAEIKMLIDRNRKIALVGLLITLLGAFLYLQTSWGQTIGLILAWIGIPLVWYAVIRGQIDLLKKLKKSSAKDSPDK